jgi:Tfp pilus assembly protein PilF
LEGPEASFNAGVCHLQRSDASRAEASFSGLVERTRSSDRKDRLPDMPEIRNNLGVARLRLGKPGDAAAEFERATSLDAEEPMYWENLGIAKLAAKQPDAAVAPLERARKLDPDDKLARTLLISTFESLGRASDAAALRAESASNTGATIAAQDPAALARQARVSMNFDRALLHLEGDAAAIKPARKDDTRKKEDSGVRP